MPQESPNVAWHLEFAPSACSKLNSIEHQSTSLVLRFLIPCPLEGIIQLAQTLIDLLCGVPTSVYTSAASACPEVAVTVQEGGREACPGRRPHQLHQPQPTPSCDG